MVAPWKVSARLMDWEDRAVLKPRPSDGIIVDWQRKASTELPSWPPSASSLGRFVTLSLQTAALWPWQKTDEWINIILVMWFLLISGVGVVPQLHTGWYWRGGSTLCLSQWSWAHSWWTQQRSEHWSHTEVSDSGECMWTNSRWNTHCAPKIETFKRERSYTY